MTAANGFSEGPKVWSEVLNIIERLARGTTLSPDHVNSVLGIALEQTVDNSVARRFNAELHVGPLRKIELREVPDTGVSFLVMRANPDRPVVVPSNGMHQFGNMKWRAVEPRTPPEGVVAECYNVGDMELRVGYGVLSRILEVVSLGQPPDSH
jgi:hypothetical protein